MNKKQPNYKNKCNKLEKELEWACEQLEILEGWANDIRTEAYNCRNVLRRMVPKRK